jgi:serine/threonine-protein kinase
MHCGGAVTLAGPAGSSRVVPPTDQLREQLVHATLGEYQIHQELGRGGMAAVYLAEDLSLGRRVAIKVMIPGLDLTEGMADRFLLEARTAAQLSHPHIIPIHAVRTTGNLRYFVMKFIAGRSLDRVVAEEGPLPFPVVRAVLAQVGSALEHAHRRGVVHRDIKPANIMLDEDGAAIVADFGIAKVSQGVSLTQTGSTVGTPTYMSPEQCSGRAVTGASDQYALGCVTFELIAGRPPFVHDEVMPVLLAHVSDPPPALNTLRPECPQELALAVERMLVKEATGRWPTLIDAVSAADAGRFGADPEVRETLRRLSGADGHAAVIAMPSIPVSPPLPQTVLITPPRGNTRVSEVLSVGIEPNGALLTAGSGIKLQATARSREGLPVSGAQVEWKSASPGVVGVSTSGVVTALGEGQAAVTATVGAASATVMIRVARVPVSLLRVGGLPEVWEVGQHQVLTAVPLDQAGAVLPGRSARWTALDPAIATVQQDGTVEARAAGRARIQAECEGQVHEVAIEVRQPVGVLSILPGAGALAVGQVVRLMAVMDGGPEGRRTMGASWSSSNPTVLRISAEGEITAFQPGSARIRASVAGMVAEVTFQVTRVDVATVKITPRVAQVAVGEEVRLEAQAVDRLGARLEGRIVSWQSTNPAVATVAPDGTVCGIGPGTVRITAAVGGGIGALEVKVTPVSVGVIRLEPAQLELRVGESVPVRAVVQSARGGTLPGVRVVWESSDPAVVQVTDQGVVIGLRFGTARVAASVGGRRATLAVQVQARSSVSISGSGLRTPPN